MDSASIFEELEREYPDQPLHLASPYLNRVNKLMEDLLTDTAILYVAGVPETLLSLESEHYFRADRAKLLGEEIASFATQERLETAFASARPHVRELEGMLAEHAEGPFFMGNQVGAADLVVVSWMVFWRSLGIMERLVEEGEDLLVRLYDACEAWMSDNQ
jgi:glutathione S-transferase